MLLSEKIALAIILWTCGILIVTPEGMLDLLVVLVLIGVLIIRELTDVFTNKELKDRINLFIYIGLIIFIGIVIHKVVSILKIV
jgi:hypothetical protein